MSEEAKTPETPTIPVDSAIPPKLITRNEHGLINNGSVNYIYTPEGMIDWRAMINPKHLAINKFNFERKGRPLPDSVVGLDDRDLLILLPGIKELAQIRGYQCVSYNVTSPSKEYVVAVCTITYIPNFETEGRFVTFSAIGDASPENTNSFGRNYLAAIAENRAFVRAVRNFLKINIVSQEEVNQNPMGSNSQTVDPNVETMINTMAKYGVTFEKVKEILVKENYPDAAKLNSVSEINSDKLFELIGRMHKKAKAKQSTA